MPVSFRVVEEAAPVELHPLLAPLVGTTAVAKRAPVQVLEEALVMTDNQALEAPTLAQEEVIRSAPAKLV